MLVRIPSEAKKNWAKTAIVLGAGITDNKTVPLEGKRRLRIALKLYKKKFIKKIVVCGSDTNEHVKYTGAEVMRDYLFAHGVEEEDILLAIDSRDTIGDAVYARRLIDEKEKNFFLITSDYHMDRTLFCFAQVFGPKHAFFPLTCKSKNTKHRYEIEKGLLALTKFFFIPLPVGNLQVIEDALLASHPRYLHFH